MDVPLSKAKLVAVPPQTVDSYCDLAALREEFAPTERQFQKARAEIAARLADEDPAAVFTVPGERWTLLISARGFETKPNVPLVRKNMKAADFLEIATVTLKSLRDWFTQPKIDEMTIKEQTGSRTFTPLRKDV